jgi:hypothetical protein
LGKAEELRGVGWVLHKKLCVLDLGRPLFISTSRSSKLRSSVPSHYFGAAHRHSRRRKAVPTTRRFWSKPLFRDSRVGNTTWCYFRPAGNVSTVVAQCLEQISLLTTNADWIRTKYLQVNIKDMINKAYMVLSWAPMKKFKLWGTSAPRYRKSGTVFCRLLVLHGPALNGAFLWWLAQYAAWCHKPASYTSYHTICRWGKA